MILVSTKAAHNQFWKGEVRGRFLTTEVGRIGTPGQRHGYEYPSHDEAVNDLNKRANSLLINYRPCSDEEFAVLSSAARILGPSNKIERIRWMRINGDTMDEISPKEMVNPAVKPAIVAHVIQRSGQRAFRNLLFTSDGIVEFVGFMHTAEAPDKSKLKSVVMKDPRPVSDGFVDKVAQSIDYLLQKGQTP